LPCILYNKPVIFRMFIIRILRIRLAFLVFFAVFVQAHSQSAWASLNSSETPWQNRLLHLSAGSDPPFPVSPAASRTTRLKAAKRFSPSQTRAILQQGKPDNIKLLKQETAELVKQSPDQVNLEQALKLKKRSQAFQPALELFIAECYWATGNNDEAAKLSRKLLQQIESPWLRKKLYRYELDHGNPEAARRHLAKSGLNFFHRLPVSIEIFLQQYGFLVFTFTLAIAAGAIYTTLRTLRLLIKALASVFHKSFKHFSESVPEANNTHELPRLQLYPLPAQISGVTPACETSIIPAAQQIAPIKDSEPCEKPTIPVLSRYAIFQSMIGEKSFRVIGITSLKPSFTRLSLGLKLATNLAEADYQTILIDANDTMPFIHQIKNCLAAPGLEEFSDAGQIEGLMQKIPQCRFKIMAGGNDCLGFSRLSAEHWRMVLNSCRQKFDIVIVVLPCLSELVNHQAKAAEINLTVIDGATGCEDSELLKLCKDAKDYLIWSKLGETHI